jgi:hypothetical protein
MEYWEFLLQKEGDRSWLPIKSPKIEIEVGRYRVVAHSSRFSTDVEICVTHHSTEEVPPKRRSQKRSRRTNPDGLMVVIPFTYLKPGLWELRCCGDVMSDFLGNSWQQGVQLQVLPKAAEVLATDEPISPVEDAVQTGAQSDLIENLGSSSEQSESTDRTEAGEAREETENPPAIAIQASDFIHTDTSLQPRAEEAEEVEAGEETPFSISSALPTPQNRPDIAVESAPTEIEAPSLTPLAAEAEAVVLGEWDEELEITLKERESGSIEDWEPPQPNSETDQQCNHPQIELNSATLISHPADLPDFPHPLFEELPVTNLGDEAESVPATLADPVIPLEPAESDQNLEQLSISNDLAEVAIPTNPILDQSLQMLEQILQQVLDPVMQEFEQSEPIDEPEIPITPEPELPLEIISHQPGLILTLDEDALVTRRGESLTVSGQIDVLDVEPLNGNKTASTSNPIFQGTLRYELRDPQTSQVLLDVQLPISEQSLPLAFSHALEIPLDCQTRLILGKATLYGSTAVALVSQPFSVTADLDELLGAIIPGTKVMPVAKMLVLANTRADSQEENEVELPEESSPRLSQAFLDLVQSPQSRQPLPLQPVSRQPLPPQIFQSPPNHKATQSPQLPKLPNIRPITTVDSSVALSTPEGVEINLEDDLELWSPSEQSAVSQQLALADDLSPDTLNQELGAMADHMAIESETQATVQQWEVTPVQEDSIGDSSAGFLDVAGLSDLPMLVADSDLSALDAINTPETSESTVATQGDTSDGSDMLASVMSADEALLSDWEAIEWLDSPALDMELEQEATDDPTAVDNAFQALKLQDRFWTRLNSLATDADLSKSLQSDSSPSTHSTNLVEGRQALNLDSVVDVEDVTQQLAPDIPLTDFDESIWAEETEEFDSLATDTSSPPDESTSPKEQEAPDQPLLIDKAYTNWASQEIVVEDEELLAPKQPMKDASGMVYPTEVLGSQPESKILEAQYLPMRQFELPPLPAPILFIPTRELPAGEPVTVRVKVPPHSARLCVKLWVQDRQSRSLLDGPRWLVDLLPDGAGKLEAMTQLIVPFGSVEIRVEAIAVDLDSQRESHKVAVDCIVVPPDLPDISLDEFEQ